MPQNVCHFIPFQKDGHSVHTIHFVLETKEQVYTHLKTESVYKMYYVVGGRGVLHTAGSRTALQRGDIFFTFPAFPFAIETAEDMQYMYISFVGLRGNAMMESIGVGKTNYIFHGADEVEDFWKKGIEAREVVMDWMSESVLLYTFSYLGGRLLSGKDAPRQHRSVDLIKKYIDDHFGDPHFSLERMGVDLSYNKKHISHIFKKRTGIGVIEYLNTVRMQNACTLMEQGFSCVADIAERCGYADVQYFSKVFKAKMGVPPSRYMKNPNR